MPVSDFPKSKLKINYSAPLRLCVWITWRLGVLGILTDDHDLQCASDLGMQLHGHIH